MKEKIGKRERKRKREKEEEREKEKMALDAKLFLLGMNVTARKEKYFYERHKRAAGAILIQNWVQKEADIITNGWTEYYMDDRRMKNEGILGRCQCEQMANASVKYLAIQINENLPNCIDICQTILRYFALNKPSHELPGFVFNQICENSPNLVTLAGATTI